MFLVKTATTVAPAISMSQNEGQRSFFLVSPVQIVIGDVIDI